MRRNGAGARALGLRALPVLGSTIVALGCANLEAAQALETGAPLLAPPTGPWEPVHIQAAGLHPMFWEEGGPQLFYRMSPSETETHFLGEVERVLRGAAILQPLVDAHQRPRTRDQPLLSPEPNPQLRMFLVPRSGPSLLCVFAPLLPCDQVTVYEISALAVPAERESPAGPPVAIADYVFGAPGEVSLTYLGMPAGSRLDPYYSLDLAWFPAGSRRYVHSRSIRTRSWGLFPAVWLWWESFDAVLPKVLDDILYEIVRDLERDGFLVARWMRSPTESGG